MSRPARLLVAALVIAIVFLEVITYFVYRDAIDGVFANLAVAIYGLFAVFGVWVIDRVLRFARRRRVQRPA